MKRRHVLQSLSTAGIATLIGVKTTLASSDDQLNKKWEYKTPSPYITSITVEDGHIYFGAGDRVTAIGQNQGDKHWSTPIKGGRVFNVPSLGSRLYATSFQKVAALDKQTGTKEWEKHVATGATSQPVNVRDAIVVAHDRDFRVSGTCGMKAFGPDGELLWEISLKGGKVTDPLARKGTVFVGTSSGDAYGIDAATGEKIWRTNVSTSIIHKSVSLRGSIHFVDEIGRYYALDKQTGEIENEISTIRPTIDSSPVSGEESVIIPGESGMSAIGPGSTVKWSYPTESSVTHPIVRDNMVYFGDSTGGIHEFQLETGNGREIRDFSAVSWHRNDQLFQGFTGAPIVADNKMVIPRSGGIITSITLNN